MLKDFYCELSMVAVRDNEAQLGKNIVLKNINKVTFWIFV